MPVYSYDNDTSNPACQCIAIFSALQKRLQIAVVFNFEIWNENLASNSRILVSDSFSSSIPPYYFRVIFQQMFPDERNFKEVIPMHLFLVLTRICAKRGGGGATIKIAVLFSPIASTSSILMKNVIFLQFQYFHNYILFYNFVCLVWCTHYDTSISDRCNILDMGKLGDNNQYEGHDEPHV